MEENKLKNKMVSGLIWTFGERITAQLVSTVVALVLARILDPEHYGVVSIVTIFISFCDIFVSSSFGKAVVQKRKAEQSDYNTAFVISMILGCILYILAFISAPLLARFFNMDELVSLTRVMALRIPIAAVNSTQQAYIQKQMQFKKFFISTLFGTVLSGIMGIFCALKGFGVWALVFQYLTNTIVDTIVLLLVSGWKPKVELNKKSAHEIIAFGWKILAGDLIATICVDLRSLLIGKFFGAAELAYFDQGNRYPKLFVNNLTVAISKVMLPAFSSHQNENAEIKRMLRKSICISVFLLAPIMIGFASVANNFVTVFLTDKWKMCVPFIQIFCLSYLTRPIETFCCQAILAQGRSDITLKTMIVINISSFCVLVIAVFYFKSVLAVAIGALLDTVVSLICYMRYSNNLIGYHLKEQLEDIIPPICVALIMGVLVLNTGRLFSNAIIALFVQIIIGVIVYIGVSKAFKIYGYTWFYSLIKGRKQ